MNIRSTLVITACTVMAALTWAGCETVQNTRFVNASNPYKDDTIEIAVRFLGEGDLNGRYGNNNPFVAPSRVFTKFEFQVFEVYIDSVQPIEETIALKDIRFNFGSENTPPLTPNQLTAFWNREVEVHGSESVHSRYLFTIRQAMVPHIVTVPTLGLVLFRGSFPLEGSATLTIPHPAGDSPVEFQFNYTYTTERRGFFEDLF